MSEKPSEAREMHAVAFSPNDEMQAIARRLAGEGGPVKARIGRVARKLGCSWNRAKDFYYADARIRVSADELRTARAATGAIENAADDLVEMATLVARMEALVERAETRCSGEVAREVRKAALCAGRLARARAERG